MAIIEARMQQKRGKLAKLDKDQLLPGEFAIPEDSDSIFVCISAGDVLEIPSKQAMQTLLDTLSKVVDKGEQIVEDFETLEVEKAAINDNEESTVTTFSSAKIMQLIDAINEFAIALVEELPTEDIDTHTIYFLPKEQADNDVYDEYIYINGAWEHIGSTQIDLSGYYTGDQVEAIKSELQGKIDELNSNLSDISEWKDITGSCNLGYYTVTASSKIYKNEKLRLIFVGVYVSGKVDNQSTFATIGLFNPATDTPALVCGLGAGEETVSINIGFDGANLKSSHSQHVQVTHPRYIAVIKY